MIAGALRTRAMPRLLAGTVAALACGLAALGVLFGAEITAAVRVWLDSTAYNHCFLVLPIAAYLAWERRALLAVAPIRPSPLAALAAVPVALAWLAAERLGVMEGRQLAVVAFAELLFLGVVGWPMFRRLAAPLLYLFFLVPFGAFLVPALQSVTTRFIDLGLGLTALPYFIDNHVIEIPEGTFYVAEACAGLRFLIASVAFGVLYAILTYRSWGRRAAFVAASMIVPVFANGIRALGIVWLGHVLGSAEAAAADHIIYGWVFFSAVILLLAAAGLPFRQDIDPLKPARRGALPPPRPAPRASFGAAGLLVLAALAGPATAAALDRRAAATVPALAAPDIAGCTPIATGAPAGSRFAATVTWDCEHGSVRLTVALFAPRAGPGAILSEFRRLTGQVGNAEFDISRLPIPGSASSWQLLISRLPPPGAGAAALWIDGKPSGGGLAMRIGQAIDSFAGSPLAPVAIVATLDFGRAPAQAGRDWPEQALTAFLTARPELAAIAHDLALRGWAG